MDTDIEDLNIRHFKLSSGEEVVGLVLSDTEVKEVGLTDPSLITLNRPMRLECIEKPDTTMFLFHEYQPMSKYPYSFLNPVHVISHAECADEIKYQYLQVCMGSPDGLTDLAILDEAPEDDTDEFLDAMEMAPKEPTKLH